MKHIIGGQEYLRRKFGENDSKTFDYLMINIPGPCNYNCRKCFNKYALKSYFGTRDSRTWLEYFEKIVIEGKKIGLRAVVISGEGEPTISKIFDETVTIAGENGLIPIVFTNGSMLDESTITKYLPFQPVFLINYDSHYETLYDELVNKRGAHARIRSNLETLRSIYKSGQEIINSKIFCRLALISTLTSNNIQEINTIKEFAGGDFVHVVNSTANVGGASEPNNLECSSADYYRSVARSLSETGGHSMQCGDYCGLLIRGLSIDVDGTILPCAHCTGLRGKRYDMYSLTNNNKNNIDRTFLTDLFAREQNLIRIFFSEFGQNSCILRHKEYGRGVINSQLFLFHR